MPAKQKKRTKQTTQTQADRGPSIRRRAAAPKEYTFSIGDDWALGIGAVIRVVATNRQTALTMARGAANWLSEGQELGNGGADETGRISLRVYGSGQSITLKHLVEVEAFERDSEEWDVEE